MRLKSSNKKSLLIEIQAFLRKHPIRFKSNFYIEQDIDNFGSILQSKVMTT